VTALMGSPIGDRARPCVRALAGGAATELDVRAQPGAKRSGFAGFWNGMPKIAVAAPPEKGRANAEIVQAIAQLFGLKSSGVEPIRAGKSRVKSFRLACAPGHVNAKLDALEQELAARSDAKAPRVPRGSAQRTGRPPA
jgi:uncharacterized protein YggU (UPF0235/DUF167 family)